MNCNEQNWKYRLCNGRFRGKVLVGVLICLLFPGVVLLWSAEAPDISLKDINGQRHQISEYLGKGKWTMVNFWGPGCPFCQEELPELVRFHNEHKNTDAIILGIAVGYPDFGDASPDEVASFIKEYRISYPVLMGNEEVFERFGGGPLLALPTTYAFTPEGELVGVQIGLITREIMENFISNFFPE